MMKFIAFVTLFAALAQPAFMIKGGEPIEIQDYPFLAQLSIKKPSGSTGRCSASIVAPQFVISAYHCIHKEEFDEDYAVKNLPVVTGTSKVYRSNDPSGVVHRVERFYHKEYTNYTWFPTAIDFLIIKLTAPIEFNETQQPIRLSADESLNAGDPAFIAGAGGENASTFKKGEITVEIAGDLVYNYDDSAVGGEGGDSGGPLFSKVNDEWIFNAVNPNSGTGGRISYFCPWIKEVTEGELHC